MLNFAPCAVHKGEHSLYCTEFCYTKFNKVKIYSLDRYYSDNSFPNQRIN